MLFSRNQLYFIEKHISAPLINTSNAYYEFFYDGYKSLRFVIETLQQGDFLFIDATNTLLTRLDHINLFEALLLLNANGIHFQVNSYAE